jgi:hypothetical protein
MGLDFSGGPRIASFDPRVMTETQEHPLGFKMKATDGRVWRYGLADSNGSTAGQLYVSNANEANHANVTVQTAAAINATSVTVTLGATAATANEYADGLLIPSDVAPEGIAGFEIKSHPAADASATLALALKEPLSEAFTTSSQVTLIHNPYRAVETTTTQTIPPAGVASVDITASYYGWYQTRGPAAVLIDATAPAVGLSVTISDATAGAVETLDADGETNLGYMLAAGVSGEFNPVFLTID